MAAATKTTIANLALRYVGMEKITDLDTDTSVRGIILQDIYEENLDTLLRRLPWNFALKRVELTQTTAPAFGLEFAYSLPADFLRIVSCHPHDDDDSTLPYRLEINLILCNSSTLFLRYIFQVTDVTTMSPDFREAFAWRLARGLSLGGVKSVRTMKEIDAQYRSALAVAASADGMEDSPERFPQGSWVASRY